MKNGLGEKQDEHYFHCRIQKKKSVYRQNTISRNSRELPAGFNLLDFHRGIRLL